MLPTLYRQLEIQNMESCTGAASRGLADDGVIGHRGVRFEEGNFPPPNGGLLVFTILPHGNPACASYEGGSCL